MQTGAVLQVLLAVIGSITFAPTANAILSGAALGDGVSLPVGDLIATVAALQLIPFALGILTRHWAEPRAVEWSEFALRTSNVTFLFVIAGAFLGNWETIVDLVGSRVNLAAIVASAVIIAIGYIAAVGRSPPPDMRPRWSSRARTPARRSPPSQSRSMAIPTSSGRSSRFSCSRRRRNRGATLTRVGVDGFQHGACSGRVMGVGD